MGAKKRITNVWVAMDERPAYACGPYFVDFYHGKPYRRVEANGCVTFHRGPRARMLTNECIDVMRAVTGLELEPGQCKKITIHIKEVS